MIDHISIRDFAIIDNVEVDFSEGLSIITGETGSGKSILVTAISLALGSRADSSYVRNGKEKAVVELTATLENDGECEEIVISREVNSSGKNLCKLNGEIVTLAQLSAKCKDIADIHGQYDNQSLIDSDTHIDIVDGYHSQIISPIKKDYFDKYQSYIRSKRNLEELLSLESENARKLDYYRYELREIENADMLPGEDEELRNRLSVLQNSEKIYASAKTAYENVNGDGNNISGAFYALGNAVDSLEEIEGFSSEIRSIFEESRDIYYRLEDVSLSMSKIMDSLTYDPGEIDSIIERLNQLDSLKKKYGGRDGSIEAVIEYRDKISKELDKIENFDEERKNLELEYRSNLKAALEKGKLLTDARKESADELGKKILSELKDLSFDDADLRIELTPLGDEPGENGMERAEILITTNIGEPLKPLAKTSSGGEISRIMLAIKNITASYDNVPTLIFDEIDQGISGRTAAIVGKKLKEISENHQVICITHLPQIAARGDTGYRIFKESDSSKTYTHIERLDKESQVVEIARLLGGENITDTAMENAKELILQMK